MPEFSILIAAHNAGRTIEAALSSVFAQTCGDFEVIVVDDGSTDDTAACLALYASRVRYCVQPRAGLVSALNAGLLLAQGDILAFLDPTGLWLPRKLERQHRYFATYPETGLVYGGVLTSASPGRALLDSSDIVEPGADLHPPMRAGSRPLEGTISRSTVAIRRSVVEALGLPDPSRGSDAEREWWTRLAAAVPVGRHTAPLAVVRPAAAAQTERTGSTSARSLLHDTRFRRTRATFTSAVHRLDDAITRRSSARRRVLFEAASPMSLAVFGPVFSHLRQDPRIEFWFTSCDRSWDARTIFASAGIADRVVPAHSIRWSKFDAYVNTDFWDMTWLPRRTKRVHFFHGVAGKYGLDAPVKIAPVVATFDRLMFPNRDRLRRYAEAGLIDADSPRAALIGYPKVDCLVDGSLDRAMTLARLGLSTDRPTVLYAPTWSPYSSLNAMGHEVIAALGRLNVNTVVKLHDRSYDATTRGSGGVDWRSHLLGVCERYGARLVHEADASPWLHAADVLVTDHSSVGFEFMLLDRPIVVLDSPDLITNARINPQKVAMLRRASFVAYARDQIQATVRQALDAPQAHHAERVSIADELFYCPGTATSRAVQCVYELMELPLPETAGVASPARPMTALAPLARSL